jgi:hypothetical protein
MTRTWNSQQPSQHLTDCAPVLKTVPGQVNHVVVGSAPFDTEARFTTLSVDVNPVVDAGRRPLIWTVRIDDSAIRVALREEKRVRFPEQRRDSTALLLENLTREPDLRRLTDRVADRADRLSPPLVQRRHHAVNLVRLDPDTPKPSDSRSHVLTQKRAMSGRFWAPLLSCLRESAKSRSPGSGPVTRMANRRPERLRLARLDAVLQPSQVGRREQLRGPDAQNGRADLVQEDPVPT